MIPNELENLIDMAVADGEITPQESNVLMKKAQELGVDMDEFQVVLDAKLFKAKQALAPKAQPASSGKHGSINKCPSCGSPVSGFATSCGECGYEFKNVGAVTSASMLFEQLQNVEREKSKELAEHSERKAQKLNELSQLHNSGGAMSKLFSSKEAQQKERDDLIAQMDKTARAIDKKYLDTRLNIIKIFAVPNTKEDLLELLSMASSNAYDNDGVIGPEEEVWLQKTDQIYQKIMIAASNDTKTLNQATSMIVSLIKRLPKPYKTFTRIPKEQMDIVRAELEAEKEERKTQRMNQIKQICLGWMGITLAVCVVCIILGSAISADFLFGIGTIGMIAMVWIMFKKIKSTGKDNLYE